MKYYLSDLIPRLRKYSATLDQSSFLVDKPWVVSDNNSEYEKLIFRRDGRVHLSSDGNVKDGTWEYLPEAQSLLIDYGNQKKLYQHQYLDESVLALKLDGAGEDYYLLANENTIPDTDAQSYLREKYLKENKIEVALLDDGREIELYKKRYGPDTIIESKVKYGDKFLENGTYFLQDRKEKIIVNDSKVIDTKEKRNYQNGGNSISVWQSGEIPRKGDKVEGLKLGSFKIRREGTYLVHVKHHRVSKVNDLTLRRISIGVVLVIVLLVLFAKIT